MNHVGTLLFGFACTLFGYFVGNRLAIGRDKRREFNALIDPVRSSLIGERSHPGGFKTPSDITFLKISESLPFWKRRRFDRAVKAYKNSKGSENKEKDGMGGFSWIDESIIVHAVDNLLSYLKPR